MIYKDWTIEILEKGYKLTKDEQIIIQETKPFIGGEIKAAEATAKLHIDYLVLSEELNNKLASLVKEYDPLFNNIYENLKEV